MAQNGEHTEEDMADAAADNGVEELQEPEKDEPSFSPGTPLDVTLSESDSTPDVLVSSGRSLLSSLSQGGFERLLSGVRATTGAKAGRFLFEAKVVERVKGADCVLRIGLSTARSSLFLGDGTADSFSFDSEGTYYAAEPQDDTPLQVLKACQRLPPQKVIGVVTNLDSNTVSIFVDGVRAGPPQKIPFHLRGKFLYPTITFKNVTLIVNFGKFGEKLAQLPFKCRLLAEATAGQTERPVPRSTKRQFIVPVGLPHSSYYEFVDKLKEDYPDAEEISGRRILEWCNKSGIALKSNPSPANSQDRPELGLNTKAILVMMHNLAVQAGRSCILAEVQSGLLPAERFAAIKTCAASVEKIAVVAVGEQSDSFKEWMAKKAKSAEDARLEAYERRKSIAEASGEEVPEMPDVQSTKFSGPDMSDSQIAATYAKFSLPSESEGFDKVAYAWAPKDKAADTVRQFVVQRKATVIDESLKPGSWFQEKWTQWKELRKQLQTRHAEHAKVLKTAREALPEGEELEEPKASIEAVADIHDSDGNGVPLYGRFKYEDWVLLATKYEMHLLSHAFAVDVDDADRPGMPEEHVPHYYNLYYGNKMDPNKLGKKTMPEMLKLLKGPCELVDQGKYHALISQLSKDTPAETFVKQIEQYRRDRVRRTEAGDESARLTFPRPQRPPAKAGAAPASQAAGAKRPAPSSGGAPDPKRLRPDSVPKAPVSKAPVSKAPVGKAPVGKSPVGKAPVSKAPIGKSPVGKTPPAKAPVAKAPVAKVRPA